jgi:perosamine synthetase
MSVWHSDTPMDANTVAKAERLGIPKELHPFLPDYEPRVGGNFWKYPVADPFIAPDAADAVIEALKARKISSAAGPTKHFAEELKKYFTCGSATPCCNGFGGLILALKCADIGPGCEVLCPSMTMAAVGNAVINVGATPIPVDNADGDTNPDVQQYIAACDGKSNVKCLITCHTFGVGANMEGIMKLANERGWVVIEDICEAIGTRVNGQLVGTFGEFGCASLYANKLITSGDGGFVIAKKEEYQARLTSLVNHGFREDFHFVHVEASGNYKINGLASALCAPAVKHIDAVSQRRNKIATKYRSLLKDTPGMTCMPLPKYGMDAPWVFGVHMAKKEYRSPVRKILAESGIETRDWFLPLHRQPFMYSWCKGMCLPVSEQQGLCSFYLPTHDHLEDSDMEFIASALRAAMEKVVKEIG